MQFEHFFGWVVSGDWLFVHRGGGEVGVGRREGRDGKKFYKRKSPTSAFRGIVWGAVFEGRGTGSEVREVSYRAEGFVWAGGSCLLGMPKDSFGGAEGFV